MPGERTLSDADRQVTAAVADLAAFVARASADLSLAEEPSRFVLALEQGAPEARHGG